MNTNIKSKFIVALTFIYIILSGCSFIKPGTISEAKSSPNIIVIYVDDMGYNDLSTFGSEINTPNLDEMARQGLKLTSFYVASSVCSPSRAALLTGRSPVRTKIDDVFFPNQAGMNPSEVTIAEMLKPIGYQTAIFGKWHLGDTPETLPLAQGFDEYYGIPYSNNMFIGENQLFANNVKFTQGFTLEIAKEAQQTVKHSRKKIGGRFNKNTLVKAKLWNNPPIMANNHIVEYPAEQSTLTQRFFDKAIDYVDRNKNKPFFMYITPAMPHTPLFASEAFKGSSEYGSVYGDVVEEIDFNIGRLQQHLSKLGLTDNTMIVFSSDNGPAIGWQKNLGNKGFKHKAGTAGSFRGGKGSQLEGGVVVPTIISWPKMIKANQSSDAITSTLDLLPTIAAITGARLPNAKLDGVNLAPHLFNTALQSERDTMFYTLKDKVAGVRHGDWKYLRKGGALLYKPSIKEDLNAQAWLFNLKDNIGETTNLINRYPEKAEALEAKIKAFEKTL